MKRNDLTNDELIALVESREQTSYGLYDAQLAKERSQAFDYFIGAPFGNEIEGRSQVVSRDVLDVIESALPQLLKIFVSGDDIVRFDPRGPEDEAASEQESAAVNYYVTQKNDAFGLFYVWFKDALLSKNGYITAWWSEEKETETETYQGLTDDQMALMLQDERVSVLEHTEYVDEIDLKQRQQAMAQLAQQAQQNPQAAQQLQQLQAQPPKLCHDVKIEITEERGCIKIDNVAPEDILVGVDTKTVCLQDSNFVQHRVMMDRAEIEEQGWEVPESAMLESDTAWEESNARDLYNEQQDRQNIEQYLVKDTYIKINGELLRLVIIGNEVVLREEAEIIPFVSITPHIMPHRHIGMSYADLTMDIQLIKSTLLRGQLDAMYLANQPRFAISDRVSLEDMLTSRPGGVVRVQGDPGTSIMPLQTPSFPPTSFQLVEYLDTAKERRTGVTAYNQGLDSNSLNKTATGVNQIMQASQQRLELVARNFAVGVKELFMLVHRMVRKYNTRPDIIRLRNEWATVDPREWKERKDMSIAVGLGTGNKDNQLMHLTSLLQQQMAMLQMGLPVVTPQNVYETVRQIALNAGFKQPEQFVTNPSQIPPQPPQPNPLIQVEQIKQQGKQQELMVQAKLDVQKFQAQQQQEQMRSANDVAIEKEKIAAQMELERYKAQLDAATELQKAQLQLEAEIQIEQFKAQNDAAIAMKQHSNELGGIVEKAKGAQGNEQMTALMQGLQAMVQSMNSPKQVIRGADGKVVGVAPV